MADLFESGHSRRSPVIAANLVSTSQPLAVQAGLWALQQGGNAIDAALAAAICLTVVEPTSNGIGSDAFAIVWDGERLHGLNASGRSSAAWSPDRFAGLTEMPTRGWEAVTVPGAVSAWVALSQRFGRLPLAKLIEPAVRYAETGMAFRRSRRRLGSVRSGRSAICRSFARRFSRPVRLRGQVIALRTRRWPKPCRKSPRLKARASIGADWPL